MGESSIDLGWGRKPLAEQLTAMGYTFDAGIIEHLDKDIGAAVRLHMRHRITDSQWRDCARKITKAVSAALAKAHPQPGEPK